MITKKTQTRGEKTSPIITYIGFIISLYKVASRRHPDPGLYDHDLSRKEARCLP